MSEYQSITLVKGREQSLQRKHPWIFSGGIKSRPKNLVEGDIVKVCDNIGNVLGIGMYQDNSIMVRMLAFEDTIIDDQYWTNKLQKAIDYRKNILGFPSLTTNAYRLFHGEGDGVSGLIIDIYNTTAVLQCHNIGVHRMQSSIAKILSKLMGDTLTSVYSKSKETLPDNYAKELTDGFIHGPELNEDIVVENGHKFIINWAEGQKTGFFLDQRDNRALIGQYSKNRSVLNCFCYTGGFSIYAGHAGATDVHSIDVSSKAMAMTDHNVALNGIQSHTSITANVMEYLSKHDEQYDVVIVDPPAFAKNISKRHNAIQAYKRLNAMAIKAIKPGGLLFTFSCSQVVTTQLFYDTIVAAGIEAGRNIRVMHHLSQGADHPVNLFHPEGHYLKGLMIYVE
jgi:23S rRNA (cytosine1962-C5)-methyltransferase